MSYTDLTSEFVYKDLLKWTSMDALAENDAFDVFLAGTRALFYQASVPAGWTKVVTQNDKALRVTTGAGGGAGGTSPMSTTFSFQHNHSIANHNHNTPTHDHTIARSGSTTAETAGVLGFLNAGGYLCFQVTTTTGTFIKQLWNPDTTTEVSASNVNDKTSFNSNNGLVTPTIQLAYADVIVGQKDA